MAFWAVSIAEDEIYELKMDSIADLYERDALRSVEEIRTVVKSFIDEIGKHPMQIIDRLCIQL